jgi:hypothetical protein
VGLTCHNYTQNANLLSWIASRRTNGQRPICHATRLAPVNRCRQQQDKARDRQPRAIAIAPEVKALHALYLFLLALTSGKIIAEKLETIPRPAATKLTYANHPFARGEQPRHNGKSRGVGRGPGIAPKRVGIQLEDCAGAAFQLPSLCG